MHIKNNRVTAKIKKGITSDALVLYLDEIDSTNNEAKRLISGGLDSNALIVADRQTAGRGRQGKSFYSMCKNGIYMTAVFVRDKLIDPARVTIAAAVAVAKSIEEATGVSSRIKWVNDLFHNGKKVCGILSESVDGFIIVGIGINCDGESFPEDLKGIAGGIPLNGVKKEELIANIYNYLRGYLDADFTQIIAEYRDRSFMKGKTIQYLKDGTYITAAVKDIDDEGRLLVITANGTCEALSSGEIMVVENLYTKN